jgi:micrococcal nuclease
MVTATATMPGSPVVEPTFTLTPTQTPSPTPNCDYANYQGTCIPHAPPHGSDLDCSEISARRFQFIGSDPHRFDGDDDGIDCEGK